MEIQPIIQSVVMSSSTQSVTNLEENTTWLSILGHLMTHAGNDEITETLIQSPAQDETEEFIPDQWLGMLQQALPPPNSTMIDMTEDVTVLAHPMPTIIYGMKSPWVQDENMQSSVNVQNIPTASMQNIDIPVEKVTVGTDMKSSQKLFELVEETVMGRNVEIVEKESEATKFYQAMRSVQKPPIDPLPKEETAVMLKSAEAKVMHEFTVKPMMLVDQMPAVLDVKAMVEEFQLNQSMEQKSFTIKLKPEGIGELVVNFVAESGKYQIQLFTQSKETAQLFQQNLPTLQANLRDYEIMVDVMMDNDAQHHSSFQRDSKRQSTKGNMMDHRRILLEASDERSHVREQLRCEHKLNTYV